MILATYAPRRLLLFARGLVAVVCVASLTGVGATDVPAGFPFGEPLAAADADNLGTSVWDLVQGRVLCQLSDDDEPSGQACSVAIAPDRTLREILCNLAHNTTSALCETVYVCLAFEPDSTAGEAVGQADLRKIVAGGKIAGQGPREGLEGRIVLDWGFWTVRGSTWAGVVC